MMGDQGKVCTLTVTAAPHPHTHISVCINWVVDVSEPGGVKAAVGVCRSLIHSPACFTGQYSTEDK